MTEASLQDIFDEVIEEAGRVAGSELSRDRKLGAICELINERVPHCDWVGFYLMDPDEDGWLTLGPFVGDPTEHKRIPVGRSICGMAAERKETIVVDDVSRQANYLSCSVKVKSEIVVPIIKNGHVLGELDIDSHRLAAFSDEHKGSFEKLCQILAELF